MDHADDRLGAREALGERRHAHSPSVLSTSSMLHTKRPYSRIAPPTKKLIPPSLIPRSRRRHTLQSVTDDASVSIGALSGPTP